MQVSTIGKAALALVLATSLPLLACSDDNDTPTSPTQPGPPVSEPAPPPATPPPTDPPPTPAPPPTDDRPIVSITGVIAIPFVRSDDGGLSFRIDDFTIVRVAGNTPVVTTSGGSGDTSHLLQGQTVTVEGRRNNGTLDATKVTIVSQP
jgi:hypothetical protein